MTNIINRSRVLVNAKELEYSLTILNSRVNIVHDSLINISQFENEAIKDNEILLKCNYVLPDNSISLRNIINHKIERKEQFLAQEIEDIYTSIINLFYYFQNNILIHGEIIPENIFKVNNKFKLLDRLGSPTPPNFNQFDSLINHKNIYLSPIIFENLIKRSNKIRHNPHKSDIFVFGLVLLECGLLKPIFDIYDVNNKQVNAQSLATKISEFNKIYYSKIPYICNNISKMLEIQEDNRIDAFDLINNTTQNNINNHKIEQKKRPDHAPLISSSIRNSERFSNDNNSNPKRPVNPPLLLSQNNNRPKTQPLIINSNITKPIHIPKIIN